MPEEMTYTDRQPMFFLYKEQRDKALEWMNNHDMEKHTINGVKRYTGAIGGAYTWQFTGTSLGVVSSLHCSCGEKVDVSDYECW